MIFNMKRSEQFLKSNFSGKYNVSTCNIMPAKDIF